jgi:serine/threonine protein kinase
MPPLAPERVGQYEIVSLLGEGGMARVYLAVLRGPADFNKLGVIKQIRPELAWDKEFITMFLDEARLAARLNHPNVVQTYQVVRDQGSYNLAMEYLEGQPLSEILQQKTHRGLPIEEHLWILSQVLAGLQYAHTLADYDGKPLGIVHRDVSPANVFVTYNGDVKLLDFGIAKASGALSATREGMFKGRLGYCAPEQLQGIVPDARVDVFAVGVILWEALACKRITDGYTPAATAQARIAGQELKIRDVYPDVAPELAAICDRALEIDPKNRYPSAAAFQHDIDAYLEKLPRRVWRTQLAERLQTHFERERRETRKRIEEQLSIPAGAAFASESPSVSPARPELVTSIENSVLGRAPKPRSSWARRIAIAVAVVIGGYFGASASWRLIHSPVSPKVSVPSPVPTPINNPPQLAPAKAEAAPSSPLPETIQPREQGVPHEPAINRIRHARDEVDRRRDHLSTRDLGKRPPPQAKGTPQPLPAQLPEPGMSLSRSGAFRTSKQIDEADPYGP